MKKLVTFVVVLLALGGGAYYYFVYSKPPEKPTVMTAAVSRGDIEQVVQATGTLEALRTVSVGSQVSGTVESLHDVDFNSIVHKDQVIASIDPTLLQQQVAIQQANIEQRNTDIASQQVQLENDQKNLQRTKDQHDAKLVSDQALEAADLQVKTRIASIESAKKQLVSAQAQLQQAELNVSYCTIKSPIDGVIVARNVDVGQTVQSSMSVATFFTIATDLTSLKLTAGVDEADIGNVRPNMVVKFTVDSYPNTTFQGKVNAVRLNATTNQNVVTYPVWIDVNNPDLRLRPSMTASVKIVVDTVANALRVPNQATRFHPTADIYTALGLQPPTAGNGRNAAGRAGGPAGAPATDPSTEGQPGAAPATSPAPAATPATTPSTPATSAAPTTKPGQTPQMAQNDTNGQNRQGRQPGQGGNGATRGQNGQGGGNANRQGRTGRGFGFGNQPSNMTPEQLAAMRQQFGQGRGGAGGRRGQQPAANASTEPNVPLKDRNADKIDELYQAMPKKYIRGSVWTWDEANKQLKSTSLTLGITDGQFTEVVNGDVQVGENIVTGVIVPQTKSAAPGANPLLGPQRGGPGGLQPGGPGGGGGGNRGGGGGGGGRGGN